MVSTARAGFLCRGARILIGHRECGRKSRIKRPERDELRVANERKKLYFERLDLAGKKAQPSGPWGGSRACK